MTVRGVRSSWLASAANSRWRRRAARWDDERLADRDERPARVEGPEPDGHEHDDAAADQQHAEDRVERLLLGGPVLDHLDVDVADVDVGPLGLGPDRAGSRPRRPHVRCPSRRRPRGSRVTGRPSGSGRPAAHGCCRSASSGIANVPDEPPPKMKPYSGPARARMRASTLSDLAGAEVELVDAVVPRGSCAALTVERDAEDDAGRAASYRPLHSDEPPADASGSGGRRSARAR